MIPAIITVVCILLGPCVRVCVCVRERERERAREQESEREGHVQTCVYAYGCMCLGQHHARRRPPLQEPHVAKPHEAYCRPPLSQNVQRPRRARRWPHEKYKHL